MTSESRPGDQEIAQTLLRRQGRTFAEEAGIALADEPEPLWQVLVLAQLMSARIRADVAVATARELWRAGWTTPSALRRSTWQQRVDALGRGGYRRYDFSTATRLENNAVLVEESWHDDLRRLRDEADGDPRRIEKALQRFDGIGPVGARIFCREAQAVWPTLRPFTDALSRKGAERVGLPTDPDALAALVAPDEMARLAAALVRSARGKH